MVMYFTLKRFSLERILQILQIEKYSLPKKNLEFGTHSGASYSFYSFTKKVDNSEIFFADNFINKGDVLKIDLENKNEINNKFDNIIIFNVLEHIYNCKNAVNELHNLLNENGKVLGSTPFMYRIHNAPKDYARYTKDYLYKILSDNGFNDIKIIALGYGPFTSCYQNMHDFIKYLYVINNVLLTSCILLDSFLKLIMKTDPKELYPLAYFFTAKK